METAIEIIKENLTATKSIINDYKAKSRFAISVNDFNGARTFDSLAQGFEEKLEKCEKALYELTSNNQLEKTA